MRRACFVFAAVILACGSDSGRQLTEADLTEMVLRTEDLGSSYTGWRPEPPASGRLSNEESMDVDFDREDETEDIRRFGRLDGYSLGYSSPNNTQSSFTTVVTSVNLFKTADGASGYFKDYWRSG